MVRFVSSSFSWSSFVVVLVSSFTQRVRDIALDCALPLVPPPGEEHDKTLPVSKHDCPELQSEESTWATTEGTANDPSCAVRPPDGSRSSGIRNCFIVDNEFVVCTLASCVSFRALSSCDVVSYRLSYACCWWRVCVCAFAFCSPSLNTDSIASDFLVSILSSLPSFSTSRFPVASDALHFWLFLTPWYEHH